MIIYAWFGIKIEENNGFEGESEKGTVSFIERVKKRKWLIKKEEEPPIGTLKHENGLPFVNKWCTI